MAKRLTLFFLIVVGVLLIGSISAALPPQTNVNIDVGLDIDFPKIDVVKINEAFEFNFHVFNRSTGLILDNTTTSCAFHLFNKSGEHIIAEQNISFDDVSKDFNINILSGNFSSTGSYYYLVDCSTSSFGGFVSSSFEVTSTGEEFTIQKAIIYSVFFAILIFIFILTIFGIEKLPPSNAKDEEGKIISINNLKYLRATLWMFEWMIVIGILFISSNLAFAYLGEELFANVLFTLFNICLGLSPIIIIVWFFWIFAEIFQDRKIKKLLERGIFPNSI